MKRIRVVFMAVFLVVSLGASVAVSAEFDPYGNLDASGGYSNSSRYREQEANRRAQEHNAEIERQYRESNREYLSKPAYEPESTWIQRPGGRSSQCVPDFYNPKVVTCY